jgi:hypothetical protein
VGCEGCITPGDQSHLCLFRERGIRWTPPPQDTYAGGVGDWRSTEDSGETGGSTRRPEPPDWTRGRIVLRDCPELCRPHFWPDYLIGRGEFL